MKVKINLYYDAGLNSFDWRIITKEDRVICGNIAGFSGAIESVYCFRTRKSAVRSATKFCKMIGMHQIDFFDKLNLEEPEISK